MKTLRCVMEPKAYSWHHKRLGLERGDLSETNTTAFLASLLPSLTLTLSIHVSFLYHSACAPHFPLSLKICMMQRRVPPLP